MRDKIICDQGGEYASSLFKDFWTQYGIEFHVAAVQQSSSNSIVERLHSTLTEIYRIVL